jgi:hypothetical protein
LSLGLLRPDGRLDRLGLASCLDEGIGADFWLVRRELPRCGLRGLPALPAAPALALRGRASADGVDFPRFADRFWPCLAMHSFR